MQPCLICMTGAGVSGNPGPPPDPSPPISALIHISQGPWCTLFPVESFSVSPSCGAPGCEPCCWCDIEFSY